MNKHLTVLVLALVLLMSACSSAPASEPSASPSAQQAALLHKYGLEGKTARQIIDTLDRSTDQRPLPLGASVRPDQLLLSDNGTQVTLPLPTDAFYVSIAPYIARTHDCFFHSLGTCQGELVGKDLRVVITDDAGTVRVDEKATTATNGFAGFWLPRGMKGTVKVSYDGRTGEVPIATTPDSATCLTTLKLT